MDMPGCPTAQSGASDGAGAAPHDESPGGCGPTEADGKITDLRGGGLPAMVTGTRLPRWSVLPWGVEWLCRIVLAIWAVLVMRRPREAVPTPGLKACIAIDCWRARSRSAPPPDDMGPAEVNDATRARIWPMSSLSL